MATIADLKEIPAPPPVSYAPQAAGWWVLAGVVLLALLVFAGVRLRRWWRNRYRREAQAALAEIERAAGAPGSRAVALAAIAPLVKRTVLAWAPRAQVAPLSGEAWLSYLDGTYPGSHFVHGAGRSLEQLAYGPASLHEDELAALIALLHRWIDGHAPA